MVHDHDIGISTGAYYELSLGAALLRIAEIAPSAEILSLGRHSLLEPVNVRVIEAAGLPFTVHGPFAHFEFGSRSASKHRGAMDLHRRHMWVAAELGAQLYVVHPDLQRRARGWNPKVAASLERAFEELSALQDEIGLPIAVENLPFSRHSHFVAPGDLDLKGLGLALDVGHAAVTGTLRAWLDVPPAGLRHVHLHDNQGHRGGDEHDPLGTGVIDLEPILAVARAAGASIVLEHKDEASVIASLDHLRSRGLLVPGLG
ncbi:MAG: sugar phosphate isomerase/epimerase [Actinobacteria bacterium]|nr:sugar phosphate isomerase/epimerase [Actinomycetota bacterium]